MKKLKLSKALSSTLLVCLPFLSAQTLAQTEMTKMTGMANQKMQAKGDEPPKDTVIHMHILLARP